MATLAGVGAAIILVASGQIGSTYTAVLIGCLVLTFLSFGLVLTGRLTHAIGVYLLLLPLAGVLGVSSPPVTQHWSLGSTILLGSLAVIAVGNCLLRGYSVAASRGALLSACLLGVSFIPSVLNSSDPARSFATYLILIISPIVVFCLVALALRSATDIKHIAKYLVAGLGLACLMGFYFVRHFEAATLGFRLAIGFPDLHINISAQILAGVIPLAVVLALKERRLLQKALWALSLVLFVGLQLSLASRTAYVGLAIGLAALGLAKVAKDRTWMIIALLVLVTLGGLFYPILLSWAVVAVEPGMVDLELVYSEHRWTLWTAAFRMIIAHPLFGVGIDMFGAEYSKYGQLLPSHQQFSGHPHNVYMQIGAESGLVALVGFAIFFLFVARHAFRHLLGRNNLKQPNWLFVGLAAGWLAYSVTMLFDGEPFGFMMNPTPGIVYMTLCACVVATGRVADRRSSANSSEHT